jgi:PleD family two-component response regulator
MQAAAAGLGRAPAWVQLPPRLDTVPKPQTGHPGWCVQRKGAAVRVLVIEDDQEMAETVAAGLRHTGMAVDVALNGPAGLERALTSDYDAVVLDRDLPGMHGDEVCGRLVAAGCRSRVLMLTDVGGDGGPSGRARPGCR